MTFRSRLAAFARAMLRGSGFDLLHHTDDPVLVALMQARERLRVNPDSPAWLWDHLLCDVAARAHLRNLVRAHAVDLAIDVGANRGQFGRLLRDIGYRGTIVSFEPTRAAHDALRHSSRSDPDWHLHRLALGDREATASVNVYRNSVFSSLHAANETGVRRFDDQLELDHVEEVPMRTLDDAMAEMIGQRPAARILLKTDTQGHDLAVLRGAGATLARASVVITEANVEAIYHDTPTYREMIDWLEARGFRLSGLYPISHQGDLSLIELDCFFVRPAPSRGSAAG